MDNGNNKIINTISDGVGGWFSRGSPDVMCVMGDGSLYYKALAYNDRLTGSTTTNDS